MIDLRGVRGLLFDLDGTLVDSAPDLALALDATLAELDHPPVGEAQARAWVGNGAKRLVARALTGQMWQDPPSTDWDRALECFFRHYGAHLVERTVLYPGVAQTLAWLRQHGYALGVVTNKPLRFTRPLLKALELGEFAVVLGGDSLAEKKPHPMPLLHAARTLGLPAKDLLMVGDSLNDVHAARGADMRVICVPYGYNHGQDIRGAHPDAVIEDFRELIGYLEQAA